MILDDLINISAGVDVNIYASSGADAWPLVGNHENIEVGHFLANYLDVDVDAVTKKLQSSDSLWMGNPLGEDVRTDALDTYHGDFKKRSTEAGADDEITHIDSRSCGCGAIH